MVSKKKLLGAAAVAVAATAAVAVVKGFGGPRRAYRVAAVGDGWAVLEAGDRPSSTHRTKKEALSAARALARAKAPSRLVIERLDGTVQEEHSYEPGE